MHNILRLKKMFQSKKNKNKPGLPTLPKGGYVKDEHLQKLYHQLEKIINYWEKDTKIGGALVSVHYNCVVAKSNRISALLKHGSNHPSESVRGARFDKSNGSKDYCHVFTHFVSLDDIKKSIRLLKIAENIVGKEYKGRITDEDLVKIGKNGLLSTKKISKTDLGKIIRDAYYVDRFAIDRMEKDIHEESIVTIYQTNADTKQLLSSLGIDIYDDRIINKTTLRLSPAEIQRLQDKASYLIAMSVTDFNTISLDDINESMNISGTEGIIPHPSKEPVIGVIDTPFNESVYFNEWVDYIDMMGDIPVHDEDSVHGTAVSSILVDGPKGNPALDDGCGRFRVRHFGVATRRGFSAFTLLRQLNRILADNTDIRVWNLSLGSTLEIDDNFISPVAAELDRLQNEYDVIFVVAGTNRPSSAKKKDMKIGSPADSLNSVVVNSVDFKDKPASYTRVGPVLSFFNKPDISYYGGDRVSSSEKISVCCNNMGAYYEAGTSFAAPWVARKLAYMICVMGIGREVAKALLIDSASGWGGKISNKKGYGIIPKRIENIIQTKDDEIRFFLTGNVDEYETYDYSLPVPVIKDKHPFYARATLTYFPCCDRNQGVDYTCTEMDFKFGRVKRNKDSLQIVDIKNNHQAEDGLQVIYEQDARSEFRKWDNVKHISEEVVTKPRERKAYDFGMWGINIKIKERTNKRKGIGLAFGIVVTLKEMHGKDRYDDFFKLCQSNGWFVQAVDAKVNLDVYLRQEEDLYLE